MRDEHPGSYSKRGVFVCFEGGDGAGKSTQSRELYEWLVSLGFKALLTFEPGDTQVGETLRDLVLSPETGEISPRTEALLYAADKAEHVEAKVRPALDRGEVVITDRYVDSALAYQGAGRTLEPAHIAWLQRWATADLRPHLTVVLDVAPEKGLGRIDERDRIEAEGAAFHQRARNAFLAFAREDPKHYLVLDARLPIHELARAVRQRVEPLLNQASR